ncbi:HK97 family phage prohead protease [Actinophytocola sp. NPDC049390]|uniref:HK97 family phage prohead protease n=1 Tax=Actinophytocola sp. NPDC049390 TaxID=3363894 RepID=UPI0037A16AA9
MATATFSRFHVQLRAQITGNKVEGHAAVFGQIATVPGHYEALERGAFTDVLKNPDTDVRALVNHDANLLLARQSAGTLRISQDSEGLPFDLDLPNTSYANDLRELLERGDINGASFAFLPGKDRWDRAPDGRQLRTHTSVSQLLDVSVVTFPAYEGAGVSLRSYDFSGTSRQREQLIRARARVRLGRA